MAYVDARMSQMHEGTEIHHGSSPSTRPVRTNLDQGQNDPTLRGKQPAGAGKLQEIDLGPDATRLNVLRTQAATARINAQGVYVEDSRSAPNDKKGKTRRGRRQRRTSEDLERDRLVEKILSESKREHSYILFRAFDILTLTVDMYAQSADPTSRGVGADDQADDDRIAEEFTREFIDTQQNRSQARKTTVATSQRTGDEKSRGPKLGGSRNVRAAMHKAMEGPTKKR